MARPSSSRGRAAASALRNHTWRRTLGLAWGAGLLCCSSARSQDILINRDEGFEAKTAVAPFAFYNENLSFGAGPAFIASGYGQEQLSFLLGGFVTTNGSRSLFFFNSDYKLPFGERLFLDSRISLSKFDEFESYVDGNPRFPNERAGSHNSDEDNFIEGDGEDDFVQLKLKYLFPLGHGRARPINTYVLDRGLLVEGATGGESFNPFKSGRTYLELEAFYRRQDVDATFAESKLRTNGLKLSLRYDNRDFAINPSRGNMLRLAVSRDFDSFDSSGSWTAVDGEFSQFFSLGAPGHFRQIVLALNAWTSYSPTWQDDGSGQPPVFAGATLGGLDRMRGYPQARFYDKAAIYYAAELRMIPEWNPVGEGSILEWLEIDWIMFAPFVEFGRVADHWSVRELHRDMNWSAGLGLRAMAKHVVLRLDTGVSEEGAKFQMMVQHSF
jgi:hypothetical protein